jgi:hypothetical protein
MGSFRTRIFEKHTRPAPQSALMKCINAIAGFVIILAVVSAVLPRELSIVFRIFVDLNVIVFAKKSFRMK